MSASLAMTALLLGVAGGPHCAAMCGAACAGIGQLAPGSRRRALWSFQAGRLAGYTLAGAAAATAVQSFAWLTRQAALLQPLWLLFHLAVLAWGLALLVQARQPVWVGGAGRAVWQRLRPVAAAPGGVFATGALWAFMPCGLLYSALLVASLTGGPLEGALAMALFAAGSAVSLVGAPLLLGRLRQAWGTRAAGALLVLAAGAGLWMDMGRRIAQWCGAG